MRRALYAVLAGALGACGTIGHEKVEGWPELRIVEHYVSAQAMLERWIEIAGEKPWKTAGKSACLTTP